MDKEKAIGVDDQIHGTHRLCHPLGVPFPESSEIITCTHLKWESNQHQQKVHKGPQVNADNPEQSKRRN